MFYRFQLFLLFFIFAPDQSNAQVYGCTDPLSKNYNQNATVNDGSCLYKKKKIKPVFSKVLDSKLQETSALIFWQDLLWTVNDDHDTNLYGLHPVSGEIIDVHALKNINNKDWEEISQDSSYIYIGDFGNNGAGNRTNLQILRIAKESLSEIPKIDTIHFSYSNQADFQAKKPNRTNFDCEAFIVTHDSIFLFTKQWKSKKTSVYSLSKHPGTHTALLKTSFNVNGLITGATYLEGQNKIVLCGYSRRLKPFVFLLYDYQNEDFFSGNKRKVRLRLPFHQIEGIATPNGQDFYLTNENFSLKPFIQKKQQLHKIDLSPFLLPDSQ